MAKRGRPRRRTESDCFSGNVYMELPFPVREDGVLVGYEWKRTDLINLLNSLPYGYSPFTEAEGYRFSTDEAQVISHFIINECCFPEGENAGKPFVPERWQWAVLLNAYCWFEKEKPTIRRFNEVFVYIPRKNGKTTAFGAIPALISLFVDPENRSQNFCCAADSEQAALNFRHAAYMVEQNPRLLNKLTQGRVRHGLKYMEHNNGRTLKVLSSIAETKHGLSPNYVGIDEVHAHSNSDLIDVMLTGTASRKNPIIFYTTTADYDRPSICNQLYARAVRIAKGIHSDPNFLPVIYEADTSDNWEDPAVWKKANPNFGVSVQESYFKKELNRVKNSPVNLSRFLRLHLNIRTAVETAWISPSLWDRQSPQYKKSDLLELETVRSFMEDFSPWFDITSSSQWGNRQTRTIQKQFLPWYTWLFETVENLRDAECYAAYDNSSVQDIASLVLFFPETTTLIPFFWVPAESISRRTEEDSIPYQTWYQAGLVNNTPQTAIDEEKIVEAMIGERGILTWFQDIRMVAFDAWGANFIHNKLQDYGFECRSYSQSFSGMNDPSKKLEAWAERSLVRHGGNPVLSWMISNTMITQDNYDRIRPSRKDSSDKIDGVVAAIMAIGTWIFSEENTIHEMTTMKVGG